MSRPRSCERSRTVEPPAVFIKRFRGPRLTRPGPPLESFPP